MKLVLPLFRGLGGRASHEQVEAHDARRDVVSKGKTFRRSEVFSPQTTTHLLCTKTKILPQLPSTSHSNQPIPIMSYYQFDTPSEGSTSRPRSKPQPLDLSPPSITILSTSPSSSLASTLSSREEVRTKMEQRVFASTKPFWKVAKDVFKKEKVQKQKSPSLTKEEVVVARQLYEEWNARYVYIFYRLYQEIED